MIDVFYKIKALSERGVKIHLHCFEYGRAQSEELKKYCFKVSYYKRQNNFLKFIGPTPYIIKSRSSEELIENLLMDENPILMEGLHCCYYLDDKRLSNRKKIVRTHNVEQVYYHKLSQAESNPLKKMYFSQEASKLESFEQKLVNASAIAAISQSDALFYQKKYKNISTISAFHPDNKLNIIEGKGDFVLYHGNLSVGENNAAALFLVKEVFSNLNTPLIIAGNRPSIELRSEATKYSNIQIIDNYSTDQITELIKQAHINLLPTFQSTGIKLKLLSALHNGRYCLVNSPMVKGTGLEKFCIVKDNPEAIISEIHNLMAQTFSEEDIKARAELLTGNFSNAINAERLISVLDYKGVMK